MPLKDRIEEYLAKVLGTKARCRKIHLREDGYIVVSVDAEDGFRATLLTPFTRADAPLAH